MALWQILLVTKLPLGQWQFTRSAAAFGSTDDASPALIAHFIIFTWSYFVGLSGLSQKREGGQQGRLMHC